MSLRRVYETTFIVNAALEDQDIDAVISKVSGYIENHGGVIQVVDKWGRRRLAYPINKKYNGYYVHIEFEAAPNTLPILERFLVLEDTILRHLTLVLEEKLRELRKRRALEDREKESEDKEKAEKDSPAKDEKPEENQEENKEENEEENEETPAEDDE